MQQKSCTKTRSPRLKSLQLSYQAANMSVPLADVQKEWMIFGQIHMLSKYHPLKRYSKDKIYYRVILFTFLFKQWFQYHKTMSFSAHGFIIFEPLFLLQTSVISWIPGAAPGKLPPGALVLRSSKAFFLFWGCLRFFCFSGKAPLCVRIISFCVLSKSKIRR